MSSRTTDKLGAAVATGDSGEGSPIETDPLGGSVGTMTPYFEPIVYAPDPEYPDLIPFSTGGHNMPGQDFASLYAFFGSRIADLPGFGTNWGSFLALSARNGRSGSRAINYTVVVRNPKSAGAGVECEFSNSKPGKYIEVGVGAGPLP